MTRHLLWPALAALLGIVVFVAAYLVGVAIGLALIAALLVTVLLAVIMGGWKALRARTGRKGAVQRT